MTFLARPRPVARSVGIKSSPSSSFSHQTGYPRASLGQSEPRTQHACVFRSKMANNVVAAQKVRARAPSAVASLVPWRAPNLKIFAPLPDWAS